MSARHLKKVISRPDSLKTVNLKTILRCLKDVLLRRGFQQLSPQYRRDKKRIFAAFDEEHNVRNS